MARLKKNQVKYRKGRPQPSRKKQTSTGVGLVIGTLIAAALIAAVVFFLRSSGAAPLQAFDLSNQPVLGQADAPVTMVVVEDFKCPACRNFEQQVMPQLTRQYVDSGRLKVASLIWPFLAEAQKLPVDDSMLAAEAAACVYNQQGSAGYDAYKAVLFGNQEDERTVWATQDKLKALAGGLEQLNQTQFARCLDTGAARAQVLNTRKQVRAAGVTSTPSVFINGRLITDTTAAGLTAAIEAAAP